MLYRGWGEPAFPTKTETAFFSSVGAGKVSRRPQCNRSRRSWLEPLSCRAACLGVWKLKRRCLGCCICRISASDIVLHHPLGPQQWFCLVWLGWSWSTVRGVPDRQRQERGIIADVPQKLQILWHDLDPLCVMGSAGAVLQHLQQESFSRCLKTQQSIWCHPVLLGLICPTLLSLNSTGPNGLTFDDVWNKASKSCFGDQKIRGGGALQALNFPLHTALPYTEPSVNHLVGQGLAWGSCQPPKTEHGLAYPRNLSMSTRFTIFIRKVYPCVWKRWLVGESWEIISQNNVWR